MKVAIAVAFGCPAVTVFKEFLRLIKYRMKKTIINMVSIYYTEVFVIFLLNIGQKIVIAFEGKLFDPIINPNKIV